MCLSPTQQRRLKERFFIQEGIDSQSDAVSPQECVRRMLVTVKNVEDRTNSWVNHWPSCTIESTFLNGYQNGYEVNSLCYT